MCAHLWRFLLENRGTLVVLSIFDSGAASMLYYSAAASLSAQTTKVNTLRPLPKSFSNKDGLPSEEERIDFPHSAVSSPSTPFAETRWLEPKSVCSAVAA